MNLNVRHKSGSDAILESEKRQVLAKSHRDETSEELYVQACQEAGVVPASYFMRHMNNTSMDLKHHGLGPRGARAIAASLQFNKCITHLNLEDNWIQPEGAVDLVEMLRKNYYIQDLNISNNYLGVRGAEVISKMLLDNTSLLCLKLAQNEFDDESVKYFVEALSANFRLTELDLSHNEFCEKGGEYLGQILASNEGLQVLNLGWNHIRMKGAIALSAGLRANGMLKVLNLSYNGFGNEGALALGEALRVNFSLVQLDITCNRINNEGIRLLCKGLEINETLRVLKLSNNPINVEAAILLLNTISNRPECKMEELDISNVLVNPSFLVRLETVSSYHPTLRVLYAGEQGFMPRKPAYRKDPMKVIQNYLNERKLRMLDFFKNMDKDSTMRIPVSEFRRHITLAGLPLNGAQLDALVQTLDKDETGFVDYRDLVDTRNKMVRDQREEQRRKERKKRQKKQRSERALRSFHSAVRAFTPPPASRGAQDHSISPVHVSVTSLSSWYQEEEQGPILRFSAIKRKTTEEESTLQNLGPEQYYSSQGSLGSQCLSEPLTLLESSPSPLCDSG
ncbi:leucine-rich repeat-containing protein 74A [Xenopus laevis]|uniref:Leucine-rich repeat-containing protein 74A n=1 Tax=Xenopus laevis TaxID=8355 RepID=A0A8J1LL57_XENLA|nr:leucine-rich repeat-containing protein 74A [Xenopus laevis]